MYVITFECSVVICLLTVIYTSNFYEYNKYYVKDTFCLILLDHLCRYLNISSTQEIILNCDASVIDNISNARGSLRSIHNNNEFKITPKLYTV